jgi:hypothetical protein
MASGRGRVGPRAARLLVKVFERTMFIGDPCPMKSTGILPAFAGFSAVSIPDPPEGDGMIPISAFS